ncbi:unnamed protein product [Lactuca saligna]|uniref:Uncharacterized protein n=1 Tax=Lactuca saligna TaxID=75948 RepID=A0AA35ZXX0_LACSI|nr:unnamed protein product [Lactuca saligna]
MTKEHQENLDNANKTVSDSNAICREATKKVRKLIYEAQTFMKSLQTFAESSTSKANEAIVALHTSLQKEKEVLVQVRTDLQKDYIEFLTSISSEIDKLHEDMELERRIMYELSTKITKVQVQAAKLAQANKEIKEIHFERAVIMSCVGDVNAFLSSLLYTQDPILPISIRRHLARNFLPALAMLNRIEGVF